MMCLLRSSWGRAKDVTDVLKTYHIYIKKDLTDFKAINKTRKTVHLLHSGLLRSSLQLED